MQTDPITEDKARSLVSWDTVRQNLRQLENVC